MFKLLRVSLHSLTPCLLGSLQKGKLRALDTSKGLEEDYVKAGGASRRLVAIVGDQGGGKILTRGDYGAVSAIGLTGTLNLNGGGMSNPEWNFVVEGAFTIAAGATMLCINANNTQCVVNWQTSGAISIGANANIIGTMYSDRGSIVVGASAHTGPLKALNAITVGASAFVDGQIEAGGSVSVSTTVTVYGQVDAGGAITIGAGTKSCAVCADAAITLGDTNGLFYHGQSYGTNGDGFTYDCNPDTYRACESNTCTKTNKNDGAPLYQCLATTPDDGTLDPDEVKAAFDSWMTAGNAVNITSAGADAFFASCGSA
jgi:hypothetical protein